MNKKKRLFFNGLNELRAIAALSVLVHHVELYKYKSKLHSLYDFGGYMRSFISDLGNNAVYLFFVLSGFLITYLLIEEKNETGKISIYKFYGRRILRIWPLYFIVVIIGFWLLPFLYENFTSFFQEQYFYNQRIESLIYDGNLVLYLFFMSNIALVLYGPVAGSAHSRSVSVEEQFYVVWPWIIKLFYKNLLEVLLLIIFGGILFKYAFPETLIKKLYSVSKIDFMAIGALFAYIYRYHKEKLILLLKKKVFLIILIISIVAHLFFEITSTTQALTFGLLIVCCIEWNFKVSILSYLGKLSYGIYMYHPLMMYLSFSIMNKLNIYNSMSYNVLVYSLVLGLTFLASYVSYNYIELFFLKIKSKFSPIKSGNS
ncbi:acyltransferase family protein [Psychroserpens ponticola]|uniref:Acyltransferase n=1 Tax=Psychroserpens ponticola TaxID=2932268 RepID=A0ABY7RZF1_9FLAO|nr:acyltransferase [Psychroserpens ponticola]WCO02515.1 acyltransferase [Psychroserpens ponticola]